MGYMGDCNRLLCYLYLNKFIAPTVATIIPNANPIPIAEEYFWIHYLHDKDSTILYNNYIHNFLGGSALKNSKIKFVRTWCIFELQKSQVVFDWF